MHSVYLPCRKTLRMSRNCFFSLFPLPAAPPHLFGCCLVPLACSPSFFEPNDALFSYFFILRHFPMTFCPSRIFCNPDFSGTSSFYVFFSSLPSILEHLFTGFWVRLPHLCFFPSLQFWLICPIEFFFPSPQFLSPSFLDAFSAFRHVGPLDSPPPSSVSICIFPIC